MDMGLRNRVVLVTGSSAGIGRASAVAFGREGARVAITYHTNLDGAEATADTVRQTGAETLVLPYDLNDDASIKAAVRGVLERWGTIDVLVNNAVDLAPQQWDTMGVFEDDPPERWRRMIRSGLEGVYMTIQAAVPPMRAQGWGRIVNITSNLAEDARAGGTLLRGRQVWSAWAYASSGLGARAGGHPDQRSHARLHTYGAAQPVAASATLRRHEEEDLHWPPHGAGGSGHNHRVSGLGCQRTYQRRDDPGGRRYIAAINHNYLHEPMFSISTTPIWRRNREQPHRKPVRRFGGID